MTDPTVLAAIVCGVIVAAELLARHTWFSRLGTALLVILIGAVLSNSGVIPTGSTEARPVPLYDGVFAYLAPLSIFWLMLGVDLRKVWSVGPAMLLAFGLGVVGTVLGVGLGMGLAGRVLGAPVLGADGGLSRDFAALGGMFVGTYTGGSVNFNAVALHYDVVRRGPLYAGAVAVDNIVTALWMITCLSIPRLFRGLWPTPTPSPNATQPSAPVVEPHAQDDEMVGPLDLALSLTIGLAALAASRQSAEALEVAGVSIPSLLILTVVALVLAQIPWVQRLRGPRALAMFAVYGFLTVIGAFCDIWAMADIGRVAVAIGILAGTTVFVHAAVTFFGARILGVDVETASVASQANVGGGTTALAVARAFGRDELVLPAIVVGTLGNALGTFLGFAIAAWLGA